MESVTEQSGAGSGHNQRPDSLRGSRSPPSLFSLPSSRGRIAADAIPTPISPQTMRLPLALSFALAASLLASCTVKSEVKPALRFCAIPDQNATELEAKYDAVAAHLAKELGVAVAFVAAAD